MLAWERQPGESDKAYRGFSLYRDLGTERSHRAVAEALYGVQAKYSIRTVHEWSRKFDWVDRVKALEARDQMLRRDAVEEHLREKAEDHARRESKLREQALEIREKAAEKALLMLKSPLYTQERLMDGPDGEQVTLVMKPANWTLSTAVNLCNLTQNNAGLTEEEIEATGTLDFSGLTDEEMIALIELQGKVEVKPPER